MRFRRPYLCVLALAAVCAAAQPRRTLDVPYLPTTPDAVASMLKLAHVTDADVLYDLGCGDGRIVVAAAKTYGAHAVGVDLDPDRIMEARENAKKAGVEKLVRFEQKDLFQTDIHDASVVTLFLLSSVNMRLRPKLLQELRPGTRVVSNTFMMGDWKPDRELTIGQPSLGDFSRQLYLWIVPFPRAK
jgi:SAM-dependent methyltransferase